MFAITANAAEALGEETVAAALDDPEFSRSPGGLGEIVLALENLAAKGMGDAVRRLGTRLMSRSNLLPGDRTRLAEILSRTFPGDR